MMTPDPFTSRDLIPCLTVLQPYASAIIAGIKPVENRSWKAPAWMIGRRFLIHAGRGDRFLRNEFAMQKVRRIWARAPRELPSGRIIGHVRYTGAVPIFLRPVLCPWSSGPVCWVLDDPVAIEPIEWRGAQRLFGVPAAKLPRSLVEAMRTDRGAGKEWIR